MTGTVPPIVELMRRLDHIGKGGTNDHHGFSFRGVDQIQNAVGQALREVGMFMSTEVVEYRHEGGPRSNCTIRLRVCFFNPDGSVATTGEAVGEGVDGQDKASPKAMSGALKYAVGQALMIPFDTDDPDAAPDTPAPSVNQANSEHVIAYREALKAATAAEVPLPENIGPKSGYERWDDSKLKKGVAYIGNLIAAHVLETEEKPS